MLEASLSTKKCFGLTIVASCLALLPYYASRVKDLFGSSLSDQYVYFIYMVSLILLLYLSAETNSQVKNVTNATVSAQWFFITWFVMKLQLNSSLSPFVLKTNNYTSFITSNIRICNRQTELLRRRNLLLLDIISEGVGLRGRCMTLNYTVFANVTLSF